jgi:hypothetical protein
MRRSSHRNDRFAQSLRKRRRWGCYLPRLEALEDRTLLASPVQLSGFPFYDQQGPGPITGGQADVHHNEVIGAVNAIAIDPSNAAHAYVAAVNGGIWETTNLDAVDHNGFLGLSPGHVDWAALTDQYASLSVDSLAFLPSSSSVLYAGIGDNSSAGSDGGALTGLLRTTDGGTTWQVLGEQLPVSAPAVNGSAFAAGGLLPAGKYYLKYTYIAPGGESTPSMESAQFTVKAGNIPQFSLPPLPPGVTGINIYLTPTDGPSGSETIRYATNLAPANPNNGPPANNTANPAVSDPTVAPTVDNLGGGLTGGGLPAGTYYVKYTWYNAGGQTKGSPESAQFSVTAGQVPLVTLPPLPPKSGATIYLTPVGGAKNSEAFYASGIINTTVALRGYFPGFYNLNSALPVAGTPPPATNTLPTDVTGRQPDPGRGGLAGTNVLRVIPTEFNTDGTFNSPNLNMRIVLAGTSQGVFLSPDGGQTWTPESGRPGSNLPAGGVSDLVLARSTTGNGDVLYAAIPGQGIYKATLATIGPGLFGSQLVSLQLPLQWTATNNGVDAMGNPTGKPNSLQNVPTSSPGYSGNTNVPNTVRILLAVHDSAAGDVVYAGLIQQDNGLQSLLKSNSNNFFYGIFRSTDQGTNWLPLGVPRDSDGPVDAGGQSNQDGALVADPSDPTVVYVSGDLRTGTHLNPLGMAVKNSPQGNVLRATFNTSNNQTTWQAMVGYHYGDPVDGNPHADSRFMTFAGNNLFLTCDGGVYRLSHPDSFGFNIGPIGVNHPSWVSVNGNLLINEIYSIAYDDENNVLIAGSQDDGTNIQSGDGQLEWNELDSGDGDGGFVAAKDSAGHMRYWYAVDGLKHLYQHSILPIKNSTEERFFQYNGVNLTTVEAGNVPFVVPFRVDSVGDSTRLIIAMNKNLYESFDGGATAFQLGAFAAGQQTVLVYGGRSGGQDNPDLILSGANSLLYLRAQANAPLAQVTSYKGGGIRGIVADRDNWKTVYIVDRDANVWWTSDVTDNTKPFQKLTFNLQSLTGDPRTIEQVLGQDGNKYLLVGAGNTAYGANGLPLREAASGGIYQLLTVNGQQVWLKFSQNLPNALVTDLHYYSKDDLLVVGTFGRSAYILHNIGSQVGKPGIVTVTGDSGNDNIVLGLDANNPLLLDVTFNGGAPTQVPVTAVAQINVTGGTGTANLTVDFSNGVFNPPGGINFDGGSAMQGSLTAIANNGMVVHAPVGMHDGSLPVSSPFVPTVTINYKDLAPVTVYAASDLDLITPRSGNNLVLDTPGPGLLRISGASAGTSFENTSVGTTPHVIIDAATHDMAAATDIITATAAALLAVPQTDVTLHTGPTSLATSSTSTLRAMMWSLTRPISRWSAPSRYSSTRWAPSTSPTPAWLLSTAPRQPTAWWSTPPAHLRVTCG